MGDLGRESGMMARRSSDMKIQMNPLFKKAEALKSKEASAAKKSKEASADDHFDPEVAEGATDLATHKVAQKLLAHYQADDIERWVREWRDKRKVAKELKRACKGKISKAHLTEFLDQAAALYGEEEGE